MKQISVLYLCPLGQQHQKWRLAEVPAELNVTMRRRPTRDEIIGLMPEMDAIISERSGVIDRDIITAGGYGGQLVDATHFDEYGNIRHTTFNPPTLQKLSTGDTATVEGIEFTRNGKTSWTIFPTKTSVTLTTGDKIMTCFASYNDDGIINNIDGGLQEDTVLTLPIGGKALCSEMTQHPNGTYAKLTLAQDLTITIRHVGKVHVPAGDTLLFSDRKTITGIVFITEPLTLVINNEKRTAEHALCFNANGVPIDAW